ncbi:glycoside hydrolase family 127 protein [Marinilabilia salmonicolor]|uniref:glycoside hydrolase family 127 protein n=1 Tax=Marinilabilia salmonicolor TaxID=989 RepID=UPI000495EE4D|nr:glycoside hydrolase family 127 protein [Marinilabilia salmonicolor]
MKKNLHLSVISLLSVLLFAGCNEAPKNAPDVESFPLSAVRLLDSPFKHAEQLNEKYVFAHDPDRLLAPFLIDAGLEPKAPGYGNWEGSGLNGHIGGHYLTSLALMVASTGNEEAQERLDYMIEELARCQEANGNGYVGGIPGGQPMWAEIAKGNIDAGGFSLNGKWVPLYNIHKLFAGLHDAWKYAGKEKALEILIQLTDWFIDVNSGLSDEQIQEILVSEHGGLNEVFADVYDITGEDKYLTLARQYSHRSILEPLLNHEDKLTGLHANTQIPKVVGFMRVGELAGDSAWIDASDFFWNTVVSNRTITIGGNSTHEHFHPVDDFSSMVESRQGPETCNTYNMLKLSKQLYLYKNDLRYVDYYEQALYNHILSSQHPEHGGLVYFTPMRPQHYRVYSNPEETFWCCVGSGIENHEKYGELIYAHSDDDVFVNLFIPSELNWEEKGLKLTQKTNFPDNEQTTLKVELPEARSFTIGIRYPQWMKEGEMKVTVNGKRARGGGAPGAYYQVKREWQDGDEITVNLKMHTSGEYLPDNSPFLSIKHGPFVLAAVTGKDDLEGLIADDSRMGHVAHGPLRALDEAPMLQINDENWTEKVVPVEGESMTFKAPELIVPDSEKDLRLMPFYRVHDARYMVYWRTGTTQEIDSARAAIELSEKALMELEKQTIDEVATGEQQPESEHNFKGKGTEAGVHNDRHWRHTSDWFSYDLKDPHREATRLRVTYFGGDAGRSFDILINDEVLASVELKGDGGAQFVEVDYPISASIIEKAADGVLTVKFRAAEGSLAGGIYHVRLMR